MRALLPMMLAACWTPRPCDPAECAVTCPEVAGVGALGEGTPGGVLTAFEADQLAMELKELRRGLVVDATAASLCSGDTGCAQRLVGDLPDLPVGTWHVEVPFVIPRVMQPEEVVVTYAQRCEVTVTEGAQTFTRDDLKRTGQVGVIADDKGRGLYEGPVIDSPAVDGERLCAWRVTMETKDGRTSEAEGRFHVPARSATERVPVSTGPDGEGAGSTAVIIRRGEVPPPEPSDAPGSAPPEAPGQ